MENRKPGVLLCSSATIAPKNPTRAFIPIIPIHTIQ